MNEAPLISWMLMRGSLLVLACAGFAVQGYERAAIRHAEPGAAPRIGGIGAVLLGVCVALCAAIVVYIVGIFAFLNTAMSLSHDEPLMLTLMWRAVWRSFNLAVLLETLSETFEAPAVLLLGLLLLARVTSWLWDRRARRLKLIRFLSFVALACFVERLVLHWPPWF